MNVVYIHARPQGHSTHQKYADRISNHHVYYDYALRCHDIPSGKIRKALSWILCAVLFKNKTLFNVFYSDGIAYFAVLMKKLGLINRKKQLLISLQADETIYFLKNNLYSPLSRYILLTALKSYDGFICIGDQQTKLLRELLGPAYYTKIKTIYNGIESTRMNRLLSKNPPLNNKKLLFVAHIQSEQRAYYKGLDILLNTFSILVKSDSSFELHIAGNLDEIIFNKYLLNLNIPPSKIKLLGYVKNIEDLYEDYSLYVHLARGEVWGLSIAEAALSGLPVLISDETGVKEVLDKDYELITPVDSNKAADKILMYFKSDDFKKRLLSNKVRQSFAGYKEEMAIEKFHQSFNNLYSFLIHN